MTTIMKRFTKGIVLKAESTDSSENAEGSLFHNSSESKIKAYIEGAVRQVVTNSQAQTLTNKTIVDVVLNNLVGGVTGSSLETDLNVSAASNKLATASAIKSYVDSKVSSKDEASEIAVSPTVGDAPNNNTVQKVLETHESRLDTAESTLSGHINQITAAHAASAVVVSPSGNLNSVNVQLALEELQSDINGLPSSIIVSQTSFTIANNQSSAANITGLLFNPALFRAIKIDYSIYRQTDTALSACAQMGQLRFVYNTQQSAWFMSDDYAGQDCGVSFEIDAAGQIKYTSSDISGANYVGTLKYSLIKTFGV